MKIACVQINSGADIAANIAIVQRRVAEAVALGAQLVALPENVFFMQAPGEGGVRVLYAESEHPGIIAAAAMAKHYACWMLVGSAAVKIDDSGKAVNRSLLLNPQGHITARYDKIHLFDVTLAGGESYAESSRFLPGKHVVRTEVEGVGLGMTVCYDVRFPHLYRFLAKAGAHILAVPAAFTQTTGEAHWHVLLRARAIENGCYVIAPAQTGTHPGGRKTYGHALIVDPWGRVLADAGTEEGIILADLDPKLVEQVRAQLPSLTHDREFASA